MIATSSNDCFSLHNPYLIQAEIYPSDETENIYRDELMESFERNRKRICEEAGNEWEQVHIAMGIAVFDPAQDHSAADTMRRADKIMYVNKRTGKQQAAK